eukprot:scaffold143_cov260-Pinguiococcus_pyrenoidosus.AAC.43
MPKAVPMLGSTTSSSFFTYLVVLRERYLQHHGHLLEILLLDLVRDGVAGVLGTVLELLANRRHQRLGRLCPGVGDHLVPWHHGRFGMGQDLLGDLNVHLGGNQLGGPLRGSGQLDLGAFNREGVKLLLQALLLDLKAQADELALFGFQASHHEFVLVFLCQQLVHRLLHFLESEHVRLSCLLHAQDFRDVLLALLPQCLHQLCQAAVLGHLGLPLLVQKGPDGVLQIATHVFRYLGDAASNALALLLQRMKKALLLRGRRLQRLYLGAESRRQTLHFLEHVIMTLRS